ncbi:nuclear transport factor 2 family protein [Polluticoccus soli]|uniref:nuclear transport factor 2 family protein n=1 Tax=Polluticoccus soli TaxID=3034150 RepID=UPI0023E102E4|nr:nuclear transport factor 2 family protein [Flavipsychrobacter sp. JY13-12]
MSAENNKEIIRKVNDAFAKNDMETFLASCANDVRWSMVGAHGLVGADAIREDMKTNMPSQPPVFTVKHLIAEGEMVMCDGEMTMTQKDGKEWRGAFCDVYQMRDGKIQELNSYIVEYR